MNEVCVGSFVSLLLHNAYGTLKGMDEGTASGFHYQDTTPQSGQPQPVHEDTAITWEASEFVNHEKKMSWFVLLAVIAVVLCGVMYLITDSILSTVVAGIAILAFGIMAGQKPRTLTYTVLPASIKIGEKSYSYNDFRSFSVAEEGALSSIVLQPNKRFLPMLTIYFAPDDGEKIFEALSAHIPYEEHQMDFVEKIMHRVRF